MRTPSFRQGTRHPSVRRIAGGAAGRVTAVAVVLAGLGSVASPSSGSGDCRAVVDPGADPQAALRSALTQAPGAAAADRCGDWTIELTGTFVLTQELVWATDLPLRLVGPASGTARLEATGSHRILRVATDSRVTLERLVLAGGDVSLAGAAPVGADEGGAVRARDLRLMDVELTGNAAVAGGAVSTIDLEAIRTTFVANQAEFVLGDGGAVLATGDVVLENVTFLQNLARSGGAMWLDLSEGSLAATFVTFLDNASSDADGGADLHLLADFPSTTVVTLRGVLFGGVRGGAVPERSEGPSCTGDVGILVARAGFAWTDSFAVDTSCGGPAGSIIARPTFATVAARTGMSALPAPIEGSETIDRVTCGAGWPGTDQRGTSRPQGAARRCDAGAVERDVVVVAGRTQDPTPTEEAAEPGVVSGPTPTSIPAGGGACALGRCERPGDR